MSNAHGTVTGAAGGVLTDRQGRLLGMLGKELRNSLTNTWLNYAIPAREMAKTVDEIRAHRISLLDSTGAVVAEWYSTRPGSASYHGP